MAKFGQTVLKTLSPRKPVEGWKIFSVRSQNSPHGRVAGDGGTLLPKPPVWKWPLRCEHLCVEPPCASERALPHCTTPSTYLPGLFNTVTSALKTMSRVALPLQQCIPERKGKRKPRHSISARNMAGAGKKNASFRVEAKKSTCAWLWRSLWSLWTSVFSSST